MRLSLKLLSFFALTLVGFGIASLSISGIIISVLGEYDD